MEGRQKRFSDHHGFAEPKQAEIKTRYEAPSELRGVVLQLAYECGFIPSRLREIICQVLRKRPDPNNWSERPNIAEENEELIDNCEWYRVYDIIEEILSVLRYQYAGFVTQKGIPALQYIIEELNLYFLREGIGWKVEGGFLEYRGSESFEVFTKKASSELKAKGKATASNEIQQAIQNLSRRPDADLTGAVQHALAALECLTREITGEPKETLGTLLSKNPGLLPKPVDEIATKAWGYASEFGRHLREGRTPVYEEAELMVGLSSILCLYLSKKNL